MDDFKFDISEFVPEHLLQKESIQQIVELMNLVHKDTDLEKINVINEAYKDILYRFRDYSKLSRPFQIAIIKDKGMNYLVDLVESSTFDVTKFLPFLTPIHALKGKVQGLDLVFNILGIGHTIKLWDSDPGSMYKYTGLLTIDASYFPYQEILVNIDNFVKSYLLPLVDITISIKYGTIYKEDSGLNLFIAPVEPYGELYCTTIFRGEADIPNTWRDNLCHEEYTPILVESGEYLEQETDKYSPLFDLQHQNYVSIYAENNEDIITQEIAL